MQLRHHAGVGHDPRVRREQARHVLPQGHVPGAERAAEQRGREVRAAPAQRRHLAVRGGGEESGHHRDGAAGEQGPEHLAGRPVGAGEVGRGVAEGPVRLHDFQRVHELHRSRARLPQRRREQSGAEPLSARDEIVGGPRRELAHDHEAGRDLLELGERLVDESQQLVAAGAGREQRLRGRDVAGPHGGRPCPHEFRVALHGAGGDLEQGVGHPRQRRHHDDERGVALTAYDVHGARHGGPVGQRRAAELVDLGREGGAAIDHGGEEAAQPPAMAGTTVTSSPSCTGAWNPPRNRLSSSFR